MLFPQRPPKWAFFFYHSPRGVKNGGDSRGFMGGNEISKELRSPTNEAESGMLRIRMCMWHLMFDENGWQVGESLLGAWQEWKRTEFVDQQKHLGVSQN